MTYIIIGTIIAIVGIGSISYYSGVIGIILLVIGLNVIAKGKQLIGK